MSVIVKQKILLPDNVDFEKWAVIACDQFTSQPEYWEKLAEYVGESPSTLKLVFPEVYLKGDIATRINDINATMQKYVDDGVFVETEGFILTEREVAGGKKRLGLVLSVDLEAFDYRRVRVPIRSTEDTILERLPVRLEIRKSAPVELPHILLLVDDPEKSIIEPLYAARDRYEKLYDFELNMGGGHIRGYKITDTDDVIAKFDALLDPAEQQKKYGFDAGIMLAVGDGNHSMATAKAHWEKIKATLSEEERIVHPARYALVEVNNVYDDGLVFEPIHRVVTEGADILLQTLESELSGEGNITLVTPAGDISLPCPAESGKTILAVQSIIERLLSEDKIKVDYIHGDNYLRQIVAASGGMGILMPQFCKSELIDYVMNVGNLPKKAFSIGSAENKKYYIEAKRIK